MENFNSNLSEIAYNLKLVGNEHSNYSDGSDVLHQTVQHAQYTTINLQICEQRGLSYRLWPGAVCLLEYLLSCPNLLIPSAANCPRPHTRTRVIELGCGTGFVSVCLARAMPGLHCLATDLSSVVPLVRANIARNLPALSSPTASVNNSTSQAGDSDSKATHFDEYNECLSSCSAFAHSDSRSECTSRSQLAHSVSVVRPTEAAAGDIRSECEARAVPWGDSQQMGELLREGPVALVIGSDLVYWPQLEPLLRSAIADVVEQHLQLYPDLPPPTFLFAQTHR